MSTTVKRVMGGLAAVVVILALLAAWVLGLFTPEPDEVTLADTVAVTIEESAEIAEEPTNAAQTVEADAAEEAEESEVEASDQEAVQDAAPTAAPEEQPEPTAAPVSGEAGPLDGEWQLVSSEGTFVGYRADGATGEAVGRTSAVTGTLIAKGNSVTAVDITVDMTQLTSDSRVRDDHLGDEGITWRTYPEASFTLAEPIPLPADVVADEELAFDATGMLTVREVPLSVTVALDAALVGDQLVVVGSTPISLDDFGAGIGGVADAATMEFSLVFGR